MAETVDPRALLGEFQTDFWFPHYAITGVGDWAIRVAFLPAMRGYWGTVYRTQGVVVLEGRGTEGSRVSWMSSTPWEVESQEIGLRAARGHTVVFGLGMGWQAANAALHPDTTRVSVVEADPDIIELVHTLGVIEQLPQAAREKIEVVRADANHWKPSGAVDVLLADIWEQTWAPDRITDVRWMQANVGAAEFYFWGQERYIASAARNHSQPLDWPLIRSIVAQDLNLPLILPDWPDYPDRINAGAKWWIGDQPQ